MKSQVSKRFLILTILCHYICLAVTQNTVAFSAIKGERNGPYISFQTLLVNNSAKFNPLYGVFMCTEPGLYFFTFQVLSQQNSELRVSLRTNRIPVITGFSGSKTSFNMASGTAILQLEADDIVYCFIEDGDFYESRQVNRAYTSFSGYRIGSVAGTEGGFFSSLMGRRAHPTDKTTFSNNKGSKGTTELINQIDTMDNIFDLLKNSTKV